MLKIRGATMEDAQNLLLLLWAGVFTLAVVRVVFSRGFDQSVFTWLLPTTMPILGALVAARIGIVKDNSARATLPIDPHLYAVTLMLSGLYILNLGYVLSNAAYMVMRMEGAGIILGPLEGLVVVLLGYIFFFDPLNPPRPIGPGNQKPQRRDHPEQEGD